MEAMLATMTVWGALSVLFALVHWRWIHYAPAAAMPILVPARDRLVPLHRSPA